MQQKLILSVVDQSPVRAGGTATDALRETIELAVATEAMGYQRYWLAEHHSLPNYAGTSPEVLAGLVASRTKSIRVGSGGVMLSHYSAFKVAENFRMLAAVHPGRIDLGVGRAPGGDQLTAVALTYPGQPHDISHYPQQILDLLGHLSARLHPDHVFAGIQAGPGYPEMPQVWLLGSRYESAYMAAQFGLPFAYAHFFGIEVEEGPAIVEGYRKNSDLRSSCPSHWSTLECRSYAPKPRKKPCAWLPAACWPGCSHKPGGPGAYPPRKKPWLTLTSPMNGITFRSL